MEVRIILCIFVVLTAYDLATADLTKMIFIPDSDAQPPPSCPPNEMFKHCLNNCSNCEERGFCSYTTCTESGCDCWPRFFRLTPGGPCEPVGKCPKRECPENEVFRECGPLCERCGLFGCRLIQCNHQCYCKQGYRRDYFGDCIPEEECLQRMHCSKGEVMADSGLVDEFCMHDPNYPRSTEMQNFRKCYCQPGYKRNALGHCIEERLCEYVSCIGNEVYMNCVPTCNTTCRNYGDPDCKEDDQCFPGCFCPPGYAMNDYHVCVTLENCAIENERILLFLGTPEETKDEESSQTTISEEQTATPYEEKADSSSQSEVEAQSESQAEGEADSQAESQSEAQSEVQPDTQADRQLESETAEEVEAQAEKPLEAQSAVDSRLQDEQSQSEEDTQLESETADQSQAAEKTESKGKEPSEQEASAQSQTETDSASKPATHSQADTSIVKEKTDGESKEDKPGEEFVESQSAVSEEATEDSVDEPETTTTTKTPIVRQSRRRSSSGNAKRRKQLREEVNER